MAVSIRDYQIATDQYNLYDVTFYTDQIHTVLTYSPSPVEQWLAETYQFHHRNRSDRPSTVGLDVEWRPNFSRFIDNPIATLQLCIGNRCLVFQILHSQFIPQSLAKFLWNQNGDFVFVGVGIANDVAKLWRDYGLSVGNTVDLRSLAVEKSNGGPYQNAGLKQLTWEILGREIEKPKSITLSGWDSIWLTPCQVLYACLDAFVSCEIGNFLFCCD
ncbi:3'-5' exonuclease-like [Euphorbia lathyris]|uniref:3'-5' exonuclease-like n=1 Tax=Euphorbia lathyris TaxID=212925 RepID=UPI0033133A93